MKGQFKVVWIDRHREPQCPADPRYPRGIDIPNLSGKRCCRAAVPYPAQRCGLWIVTCRLCGATFAATTAGRIDDPRTVPVVCKRPSGPTQ
jgi:hypothetical protein